MPAKNLKKNGNLFEDPHGLAHARDKPLLLRLGRYLHYNAQIHLNPNSEPLQRIPELLAAVVIFLLLLTLGMRNVMTTTTENPDSSPTPSVLSKTVEVEEIKPKIILTIKINDGSSSVNIRQKPTTNSEKIGKAEDGDTFEFISTDAGWYGVKLADGSTGFISATYIKKGEINN